jgi:outer membrane protein
VKDHCFARAASSGPSVTQTRAALVALAIALLPATVFAQEAAQAAPRSLSLEEAISVAIENNPNYLAQRNDLQVARWQTRSASADFVPSVNASTSFGYEHSGEQRFGAIGFGERPPYYSSSYNLGATLEVDGRKLLQPRVARANERATTQRVAGAEADLVSSVVQQYLSVLQQQENVTQADRELSRTGEHVRLAQARLEVGAGTQLDVRRAEVQQGQAEIRLVQAQNALATATLSLGQLMGTPLEPGVQLSSEFAVFEPQWSSAELVQRSLENNPTLLAARASLEAAGTGLRQAQSAYLPRLIFSSGVRGSVYRAGDLDPLIDQQLNASTFNSCLQNNQIRRTAGLPENTCLDPTNPIAREEVRSRLEATNPSWPFDYTRQPITASVTISLPIFTGLSRQVQVAQAQVNAQDARYQARAQELQLRTDVATGLRNLQTANRTAEIQERVRATAAEELRLAQERFRFGAASSVEVTDAQTNLAEAERALIEAVYTFHQSLAVLEALVGEPLR